MKVVLGGEGSNELGGRANPHPYQTDDCGVLEALLRRVRPDGWRVVDAISWKRIRKFRAGGHADAEERNVRGLVLEARERGAAAMVSRVEAANLAVLPPDATSLRRWLERASDVLAARS